MLRVGLTGGIGSGKSTAAQRFRELGAVVIDADQVAREVVALETTGLAAIRQRFGEAVVSADGSLNRGALGDIVFADPQSRRDLESITHPLIREHTRAIVGSTPPERIVVHDVPLIVELDLSAAYHLTVVVGAEEGVRVARLTHHRGLSEADARSRVAVQASDDARRAAADVWLDNNGTVDELRAQVDALWQDRIVGFNDNLISGSSSPRSGLPALVASDDSWPWEAARLIRRVSAALGERALAVDHIGSTSVPGLAAQDVIDLQVGVLELADGDNPEFVRALAVQGFPRAEGQENAAEPTPAWIGDGAVWPKRLHLNADPGRLVNLHVRDINGPGWRYALLFGDWLRAEPDERNAYSALKGQLAHSATSAAEYRQAKRLWWDQASERADGWARHTGWSGM